MTTTLTIAQRISTALNGDGQQWRTRPTDGGDSLTIDDLIAQYGGASVAWRDGVRTGDVYSLAFSDGSVITVAGDAWDFGFPGCFCWAGAPAPSCSEPHGGAL
jgi:hypothetical protein